jgi:hypothetical protein
MEIVVKITKKAKGYRAGEMWIDGKFFCHTIEDEDRGLVKTMPLEEIKAKKKFGITGIPFGKYQVAMTYSNRFKTYMPQILDVPGWEGVRIHIANKATELEGCIAVAVESGDDGFAGNSATAYKALLKAIKQVEKKEKIWLTIVDK